MTVGLYVPMFRAVVPKVWGGKVTPRVRGMRIEKRNVKPNQQLVKLGMAVLLQHSGLSLTYLGMSV